VLIRDRFLVVVTIVAVVECDSAVLAATGLWDFRPMFKFFETCAAKKNRPPYKGRPIPLTSKEIALLSVEKEPDTGP
jgi:hypothetical protein